MDLFSVLDTNNIPETVELAERLMKSNNRLPDRHCPVIRDFANLLKVAARQERAMWHGYEQHDSQAAKMCGGREVGRPAARVPRLGSESVDPRCPS